MLIEKNTCRRQQKKNKNERKKIFEREKLQSNRTSIMINLWPYVFEANVIATEVHFAYIVYIEHLSLGGIPTSYASRERQRKLKN
jgi:hypothetical protein